jgi:hypothetical protein
VRCEYCEKLTSELTTVIKVTGDGCGGVSEPYTEKNLCASCIESHERCEGCGVLYDEIAWSRSIWVHSFTEEDEEDFENLEFKEFHFLCNTCIQQEWLDEYGETCNMNIAKKIYNKICKNNFYNS